MGFPRRIRTVFKQFFRLPTLLVQMFTERPGQDKPARERVEAAERVRNAMYLTQFGPFTGPESDDVLGKELRDGHQRPSTETPRT